MVHSLNTDQLLNKLKKFEWNTDDYLHAPGFIQNVTEDLYKISGNESEQLLFDVIGESDTNEDVLKNTLCAIVYIAMLQDRLEITSFNQMKEIAVSPNLSWQCRIVAARVFGLGSLRIQAGEDQSLIKFGKKVIASLDVEELDIWTKYRENTSIACQQCIKIWQNRFVRNAPKGVQLVIDDEIIKSAISSGGSLREFEFREEHIEYISHCVFSSFELYDNPDNDPWFRSTFDVESGATIWTPKKPQVSVAFTWKVAKKVNGLRLAEMTCLAQKQY